MIDSVKDKARGHWRHILSALNVSESALSKPNRPCVLCGGTDRASFTDLEGRGTYYCRGCGPHDGFDLLQKLHGWDFKRAAREVERVLGVPERVKFASRPDPARALRAVYGGSRPVHPGDPVDRYLQARGLPLVPLTLRFHPGLHLQGRTYCAMLALLYDVTGKAVSIHRTYLEGNAKAPVDSPKRIMPPITTITGSAARLWPATTEVVLAEGIETAIAAASLFGLPGWACISAHGLETIVLPDSIKTVVIAADHDLNFVGQRAAYTAAARLSSEGRAVSVRVAPLPNSDWLEEWLLQRGKVAA